MFNLVLGILEPGIQGARLIYVEHFSKYLHGGGRLFTPFKGSRTHTTSELELMDKKRSRTQRSHSRRLDGTGVPRALEARFRAFGDSGQLGDPPSSDQA